MTVSSLEEACRIIKENSGSCTSLDLSELNVGDVGAVSIAFALKKNNFLQELSLRNSSIGPSGAAKLASSLRENYTLERLYIQGNNLGDKGTETLAGIFEDNESLTLLNLSNNAVGDIGAAALAEKLAKNKSLRRLYLYNNQIGNVGASALSEMIMENTHLTELFLWDNKIGREGLEDMKSAMDLAPRRSNGTLLQLKASWKVDETPKTPKSPRKAKVDSRNLSDILAQQASFASLSLDDQRSLRSLECSQQSLHKSPAPVETPRKRLSAKAMAFQGLLKNNGSSIDLANADVGTNEGGSRDIPGRRRSLLTLSEMLEKRALASNIEISTPPSTDGEYQQSKPSKYEGKDKIGGRQYLSPLPKPQNTEHKKYSSSLKRDAVNRDKIDIPVHHGDAKSSERPIRNNNYQVSIKTQHISVSGTFEGVSADPSIPALSTGQIETKGKGEASPVFQQLLNKAKARELPTQKTAVPVKPKDEEQQVKADSVFQQLLNKAKARELPTQKESISARTKETGEISGSKFKQVSKPNKERVELQHQPKTLKNKDTMPHQGKYPFQSSEREKTAGILPRDTEEPGTANASNTTGNAGIVGGMSQFQEAMMKAKATEAKTIAEAKAREVKLKKEVKKLSQFEEAMQKVKAIEDKTIESKRQRQDEKERKEKESSEFAFKALLSKAKNLKCSS